MGDKGSNGAKRRPDSATVRGFELAVMPHTDAAYNLALRLTRQAEAAEDVTHDAFLSALTGFGAFRGGDARAWILRIVRNRAYDWLRGQTRKRRVVVSLTATDDQGEFRDWEGYDPDQEDAEAMLIRKGEVGSLLSLIDSLSPPLREVLVLREMEALSYRQIAEITQAPIGSVMSRLARARAQIAAAWQGAQDANEVVG